MSWYGVHPELGWRNFYGWIGRKRYVRAQACRMCRYYNAVHNSRKSREGLTILCYRCGNKPEYRLIPLGDIATKTMYLVNTRRI